MKTNPPSDQPDPQKPDTAPTNGAKDAADYDIAPAFGQSHMCSATPGGEKAPKRNIKKIALIAVASLLTLAVLAGGALAFFGFGNAPETPAPVTTESPSASVPVTPEPTSTATSTAAPVESATAEATATPSEAATPGERPVFDSPEEEDAYFAKEARAAYPMPELTDAQMIGVAKKTCQRLDGGESMASIYEDILSLPTALAHDTSSAFGSGVGFYCPEYADDFEAYITSPSAEINELPEVKIPAFN